MLSRMTPIRSGDDRRGTDDRRRAAHTQETKTTAKTKIEVKGGKEMEVRGCLDRNAAGDYVLRDVRDADKDIRFRARPVHSDQRSDLSKRVGSRVEIKGNAVEDGVGTVTIESKMKAEGDARSDEEHETQTEAASGVSSPYLGVKSVKTLSSACHLSGWPCPCCAINVNSNTSKSHPGSRPHARFRHECRPH